MSEFIKTYSHDFSKSIFGLAMRVECNNLYSDIQSFLLTYFILV